MDSKPDLHSQAGMANRPEARTEFCFNKMRKTKMFCNLRQIEKCKEYLSVQ